MKTFRKNIGILFFLQLFLFTSAVSIFAQEAILGKEKVYYESLQIFPDSIQQKEDGMRTSGKRGTYEWWYFDAHLDDGSNIVIVFFTKPPHRVNGRMKPFCTLDIDWPDGSKIHREYNCSVKESHFSEEHCDVIMGGNFFRGNLKHYEIHFEDDSLIMDVKLERKSPSWRPHTGHWYFGKKRKKYFAWLPAVPLGDVSATIQYQGIRKDLTGSGYHDHNWYNKNILTMFHHWYWARAEIGDYTVILTQMVATKKFDNIEFPLVMISKNGNVLADNEEKLELVKKDIELDNETGKPVADKLLFHYKDRNEAYKITFDREQNIFYNKMIESTSGIQKFFAKIMGFNGAYIRFEGDVHLEHYKDEVLLEKKLDKAIWELMYFGKTKKAKRNQSSTR